MIPLSGKHGFTGCCLGVCLQPVIGSSSGFCISSDFWIFELVNQTWAYWKICQREVSVRSSPCDDASPFVREEGWSSIRIQFRSIIYSPGRSTRWSVRAWYIPRLPNWYSTVRTWFRIFRWYWFLALHLVSSFSLWFFFLGVGESEMVSVDIQPTTKMGSWTTIMNHHHWHFDRNVWFMCIFDCRDVISLFSQLHWMNARLLLLIWKKS